MGNLMSIIVPCFNEDQVIKETYHQLCSIIPKLKMDIEIIFINDGSTDNTLEQLHEIAKQCPFVKALSFPRNFGHQLAITAGMDYAKGDAIVIIDADLQDPVEVIVEMTDKWRQGFDVVYGKRVGRKGESIFKKVTAKVFYRLLAKASEDEIPTDAGDFRLIDRKVANALKRIPERSRYVRGLVSWLGFSTSYVEYIREPRFAGKTKYSLSKMVKLGLDGLISFSYKPLRIASFAGCLISAISFIYLLYVLYVGIFTHSTVSGWTSTIAVILFLGGFILVVLGIIGEYIARIYEEVKARPLYIIGETIGIDEDEYPVR